MIRRMEVWAISEKQIVLLQTFADQLSSQSRTPTLQETKEALESADRDG